VLDEILTYRQNMAMYLINIFRGAPNSNTQKISKGLNISMRGIRITILELRRPLKRIDA